MTETIGLLIGLVVGLGGSAAISAWRRSRLRGAGRARRIAFPFVGEKLSERGLDAALRLARAERATLVPAYLATVPMQLPLESALPRECEQALPLLEAIERRASHFGVPVDSRIERGRSARHALTSLMAHERYERLMIVAAGPDGGGVDADDVAWLLGREAQEVAVLRPSAPLK